MEPQSHETEQETLTQKSQTWQPQDWREGRRLRAYELAQQGWKQCRIAEALGVTKGAVSQWLARARDQGVESLKTRKGTGAPPKVTKEQKATLPDLLLKGAMAYGFTGDVWTAERVAAVIEQEWHVKYHSHYVAQLLHDCGWSRHPNQTSEASAAGHPT